MPTRPTPTRNGAASPAPSAPPKALELKPLTAAKPVPRIVLYGVEGWGKSTFAAHAESPVIIMARDETGIQRLVDSGRIPADVPVAAVTTWADLLATLDSLIANPQGRKTVALDSLGSFERLCHEEVCRRDFNDDWTERGFESFGKGAKAGAAEFLKVLARLDRLRGMGITTILLGHSAVLAFKSPGTADFDRYVCDVNQKHTWPMIARWADAIYFGKFESVVVGNKNDVTRKGKGIGGTERVLYTQRRDAWDAKPGYSVPEVIEIPDDHTKAFSTVWQHINPEK